jgi:hypothetical protein
LRTLRIANAAFSKMASVRKGEVIDAPSPKPSGTSSAL